MKNYVDKYEINIIIDTQSDLVGIFSFEISFGFGNGRLHILSGSFGHDQTE